MQDPTQTMGPYVLKLPEASGGSEVASGACVLTAGSVLMEYGGSLCLHTLRCLISCKPLSGVLWQF